MKYVVVACAGLAAGVLSGLLGVGGGIVMVPLLVMIAALTQHQAHATSLAAIAPIAAVGALIFATDGELRLDLAAALAIGALVGAPMGARIMARSTESNLKASFGILMAFVGVSMVLG